MRKKIESHYRKYNTEEIYIILKKLLLSLFNDKKFYKLREYQT